MTPGDSSRAWDLVAVHPRGARRKSSTDVIGAQTESVDIKSVEWPFVGGPGFFVYVHLFIFFF